MQRMARTAVQITARKFLEVSTGPGHRVARIERSDIDRVMNDRAGRRLWE